MATVSVIFLSMDVGARRVFLVVLIEESVVMLAKENASAHNSETEEVAGDSIALTVSDRTFEPLTLNSGSPSHLYATSTKKKNEEAEKKSSCFQL